MFSRNFACSLDWCCLPRGCFFCFVRPWVIVWLIDWSGSAAGWPWGGGEGLVACICLLDACSHPNCCRRSRCLQLCHALRFCLLYFILFCFVWLGSGVIRIEIEGGLETGN